MSNIEDTDIKIYNQKPKKENNEKNTFIKLKWFNKLVKAITNKKEDRPISVKKGLRREEMLHNAQAGACGIYFKGTPFCLLPSVCGNGGFLITSKLLKKISDFCQIAETEATHRLSYCSV